MCYLPLCVVTATSMWIVSLEVVYILLCCAFLEELGLLPTDLELTPTLSLYSEITINIRDTYNHQTHKNHLWQDKEDQSHMMTSKS